MSSNSPDKRNAHPLPPPDLPPMIGVVGWKNSGKTTLAARLIAAFERQGLHVGAIKHAHHGFDIDHEGRDSWRFRTAGARSVAVVSDSRWAVMHEPGPASEPSAEEVAAALCACGQGPCDLIIVEGYKSSPLPKIEVRSRMARSRKPLAEVHDNIIAIASDITEDTGPLPCFDRDDITALARFIATRLNLPSRTG